MIFFSFFLFSHHKQFLPKGCCRVELEIIFFYRRVFFSQSQRQLPPPILSRTRNSAWKLWTPYLLKKTSLKMLTSNQCQLSLFVHFMTNKVHQLSKICKKKNRINLKIVLKHRRVKFVGRYYHHLMPFYMVTFKDTS